MLFEPTHRIRPEAPVSFEPSIQLGERCWIEAVDAPLGFVSPRDQTRVPQHAKVPGDGWLADRKRLAEFAGAALSLAEHLDDAAPSGVG